MFSWDSGRGTKMLYLGRKINVTLKDSFLMSDFKHTGNKIFMALVWETLSANVYGKLKMVTNSLQFLLWALACSLRLHLLPAPEFESGLMTNRTQLSCAEWLQCPSQEKTTDFSLHSGDTPIHGLSPVPCYGEAQMVHGEAGRVGNPGIWLRATTEVLAHSQCKLIVMVESQGGWTLPSRSGYTSWYMWIRHWLSHWDPCQCLDQKYCR